MQPNRSMKALGALVLGMLGVAIGPFSAANGAEKTAASNTRFELDIDGLTSTYLTNASGGEVVMVDVNNLSAYPTRRIGDTGFNPITVTMTPMTPRGILTKAQDWLDQKGQAFNGDLVASDSIGRPVGLRTFTQATITEVDFPALEASSKDALLVSVRFQPTTVRVATPSTTITTPPTSQPNSNGSNFRFSVTGENTDHVFSVSALNVTQGAKGAQNPTTVTATISESDVASWMAWSKTPAARNGTLDYLSVDNRSALISLKLSGLQLVKIDGPQMTSTTSSIKTVRVTMTAAQVQITNGTHQ